jgi:hypothetical protein
MTIAAPRSRNLDVRVPEALEEFEPLSLAALVLDHLSPDDLVCADHSIEQMAWLVGTLSGMAARARALCNAVKQDLLNAVSDDEILIARANRALSDAV